jgi:DNA/RNA endonuclease YhcR with UshA esterase domain
LNLASSFAILLSLITTPPVFPIFLLFRMHFLAILAVSLILSATSVFAQAITVHDVQFTEDPNGVSPLSGQTVEVKGIVTGYGFGTGSVRYYIGDPGGGLWSGMLVNESVARTLAIGDSVVVRGIVDESGTETKLNGPELLFGPQTAASSIPPYTSTISGIGEPLEGVVVHVVRPVVTEIFTTGFQIQDATGSMRVREGFDFQNAPQIGDTLDYLRGIIALSAGAFTLNPRGDFDFGFTSNRPPLVGNVTHTPDRPTGATPVTVTALISDDNNEVTEVFLHYRFDQTSEFEAVSMHDDGAHDDGEANDGVWGGTMAAGPVHATAQYYVSARDGDGLQGYAPLGAPEETYTFLVRSITLTIFDIQYTGDPTGGESPLNGQSVTVTGIVTGSNFDGGSSFFMSDPGGGPWSGVYVYASPTTVAPGDSVRVTAIVQEFSGITELSSVSSTTILGQGIIPTPDTISTGILRGAAEAYEGGFVYVGRGVVTSTSDYGQYNQWDINDGTGVGVAVGDFGLEYVPAAGDSFTFMQGCVQYHSSPGWMIAPRTDSDIGFIDRRAPQLLTAITVTEHFVNIRFNERLANSSVEDLDNFEIIEVTNQEFPMLHIESAQLFSDGKTIQIETLESLPSTSAYQIEVSNISDFAGNILTGATLGFGGFVENEVTLIADIYNHYADYDTTRTTIRGVVNFVQDVTTSSGSRRISAFMQDGSGRGFNLSQTGAASTFPGIKRGNLIELTGVVNNFSGSIQMGSFAAGQNSSDVRVISENQPLPAPIDIRTGDLRTQAQIVRTSVPELKGSGTWCRVTGTVYQVDENVGGGTNIFVDDGSGNVTIRVWDSMELDSVNLDGEWFRLGELVGHRMSIAGPSSTFDGDFQMLAGYAEDFEDPNPVGAPSGKLILDVPNRAFAPDIGQTFPIFYDAPATGAVRLRLFNLRGQLVYTFVDKRAGGPQFLDWDGRNDLNELLPIGTYILHLESIKNGETESVTKPIVVGTRL